MRTLLRTTAAVALAAVGLFAAGPAQAATSDSDFGQHARSCAQTMGFDGAHNPGMHQGRSGWEPGHTCPMG